MQDRKIVLDTFCEVYDLLKKFATDEFWDFSRHTIISDAVYLIGRKQFIDNKKQIIELVENNVIKVILSNPHEGSETLIGQVAHCGIESLVKAGKILLIGGGNMAPEWPCLTYDNFLPKLLDYEENIIATTHSQEIYNKTNKPYKFLFLNGRMRSHRKYLLERWRLNMLLEQSLWTSLDAKPASNKKINLWHNGENLIKAVRPAHYLPAKYEVDRYQERVDIETNNSYVKFDLFNNDWGEIYLNPAAYIDTYFSVVTETVFEYPYSFRTEKIWKPIVMQHPWIAVANRGYYKDIQNLGFKTFGNLIDESFDQIDNNQERIERISVIIEDICNQDLPAFLAEAENICKYNYQHYLEMRTTVRQAFPQQFFQFINERFRV